MKQTYIYDYNNNSEFVLLEGEDNIEDSGIFFIKEFKIDDFYLKFKEPYEIQITMNYDEDCYEIHYEYENDDLLIYEENYIFKSLIYDIADSFRMLWNYYAIADDIALNKGAIKLKNKILNLLEEIPRTNIELKYEDNTHICVGDHVYIYTKFDIKLKEISDEDLFKSRHEYANHGIVKKYKNEYRVVITDDLYFPMNNEDIYKKNKEE